MLMNNWYVAGFADEITVEPNHVRMLAQDYVLFRDENGTLNCLSDICIHRGASLSRGRVHNGCIECPYHGWRYRGDGSGSEIPAHPDVRIPKRVRVDSYPVQERYGFVWVFLGDIPEEERPPIPEFPEYDAPGRRNVRGTFKWNANYGRVLENGCDFAHAAFVHPSFGNRDWPEIKKYETFPGEWSYGARLTMPTPPDKGFWGLVRGRREKVDVISEPEWHIGGMTVVLRLHMNRGWNNALFDCNTPIDENTTMTYWQLSRNFFTQKFFDSDTTRRALQIFNEDHAVLNHLNPVELPPGLREEFSVESDALMVAFRKKRQELYARGWGVDLQAYQDEYGERKAAVIPSPARRLDPKGWVLPEVPRLSHKGEPMRQAAE
ncbi:MAG: aromatic ring-hydroxylating dioxygenase subunit alpha [Rhodospirillaceae bacterium]|nr:aromatic ring-hydroxylating dioxygenase subunit alpha [Rhodospirillaceae bacterium]